MNKLKVLDLCAGLGGFSLGLERCRVDGEQAFETVAFCEIEEFPRKVLGKHWPEVKLYGDIRDVTREQLESDGIFPDVITGGIPCQPHSFSGDRKASEDERDLWGEYFRIVRENRPRWALLENVRGFLSSENGQYFGRVLRDLASIGYDAEWHIIRASSVGAPHQRERLWILAYPNGKRQQRQGGYIKSINPKKDAYREASGIVDAFQKDTLPFVCDRHDGVSKELSEPGLKGLGNSVIPQIPELLGYAILEAEK